MHMADGSADLTFSKQIIVQKMTKSKQIIALNWTKSKEIGTKLIKFKDSQFLIICNAPAGRMCVSGRVVLLFREGGEPMDGFLEEGAFSKLRMDN